MRQGRGCGALFPVQLAAGGRGFTFAWPMPQCRVRRGRASSGGGGRGGGAHERMQHSCTKPSPARFFILGASTGGGCAPCHILPCEEPGWAGREKNRSEAGSRAGKQKTAFASASASAGGLSGCWSAGSVELLECDAEPIIGLHSHCFFPARTA